MKISKKTVLGLGVLSALVVLFIAVPVIRVLAAPAPPSAADLNNATYKFLDGGNISVEISGQPAIIFTDKDITDGNRNYKPSSTFCGDGINNYGINIADGVDLRSNPINATIHVGNPVGSNCTAVAQQTIGITNPSQAGATDYQWDGNEIKSLNGANDSATFSQVPNGNDVAFGETGGGTCGYSKFILLNSANGNTGRYYELRERISNPRVSDPQNLPAELRTYLPVANCFVTRGPVNVSLAGQQGQAAAGGGGDTGSAGDSCDLDANGLSLAWLMCPLLAAANDLVNGSDQSGKGGLLGLYQDQLSFNVNRDLGTVGNRADNRVQATWSLIKNIATAILVIIMLVAIFSQSISAGPFDAYTIRKVLPRLIAAAILIQLSWYLASWIVNLVDDIGGSLTALLYAPFGGSENMQLGHLLSNGGVGGGTAAAINYLVILPALVVLGLAALPTVLFMAFSAIVAIFTALVVLVFRKIIIITCLIFAPLAILAWILPGTQRYWKMWSDNFLKVLFMYPLIVALIAAGHIFAYIAGTQGNGVFLNFILITIGVFGPLFILPKTFKWGGQFMSMAGGAISTVGQKANVGPKKFLAGRQEGWSAERKRRSQERYTHDVGFSWKRPKSFYQRPLDLVRSGQVDPTLSGRRRRQAMTGYAVAGHESEEQDIKSANTVAQMIIERVHPDEKDDYAKALAAGQKVKVDNRGRLIGERDPVTDKLIIGADGKIAGATGASTATLLERRAGLDQTTRLGGERNIAFVQQQFEEAMNSGDTKQIEMINQFSTANVQTLFSKLPHIYKNNNYAVSGHVDEHNVTRTVDGINPNDLTALSGVGMRTLRDNLMTRAAMGDAASQASLRRLTAVFDQASLDPTLKGRIPSEVANAMRELADGRAGTVDPTWGVDLTNIRTHVSRDGVVS